MFFVTWVLFVFVFSVKQHADLYREHQLLRTTIYLFAIKGYFLDVLFNIVYGTIIFRQLPHFTLKDGWKKVFENLTFTHRLKIVLESEDENSWRYKRAIWYCSKLLEPYDKGHCS